MGPNVGTPSLPLKHLAAAAGSRGALSAREREAAANACVRAHDPWALQFVQAVTGVTRADGEGDGSAVTPRSRGTRAWQVWRKSAPDGIGWHRVR
jgi:hypothetical protein